MSNVLRQAAIAYATARRTSHIAVVSRGARIAGIAAGVVIAAASMIVPPPAHAAPLRELVGRLTSEACWQLVSATPEQAKAILSDAASQTTIADRELRREHDQFDRIVTSAPLSELEAVLDRIDAARRKAYAFRIAFVSIKACYAELVDKDLPILLLKNLVRTTKGRWNAACTNTGESRIVAHASGSFVFNIADDGTLHGEYREDDGPTGAIRGTWQQRGKGMAVGGSASAGLADTVGAWKGMLGETGGGNGDVQVTKRALDLNCAGRWVAQ